MRPRRHTALSVALLLCSALFGRACETPTAPEAVSTVAVAPATSGLYPSQTVQLTATVRDADGVALTGRSIAWTTGNAAAATVSGSGLVTAVATGTATITATVEGILGTSTITVTPVPVDSVSIVPATATVIISQTRQLVATPRDSAGSALADRPVTWSSSDLARATVSATGLVTAIGLGPVTITASSEGINGNAQLTVIPVPVASVAVAPTAATRMVGLSEQFTATTLDSIGNALAGRAVTWSSSNLAIATVSATGLATAVTAGPVTITATSEGVAGTATFTVTNVPVDSVWVQPDSAIRFVGQTAQFTAATYDSIGAALTGRTVTWQTSNAAVATVSASGLATGITPGTATITATSEGVSDTAFVTLLAVPVDSVAVTPASAVRYPGQSVQLTAATFDSVGGALIGRTVTWGTSNTAVATVDASGLVTTVSVGDATITATSETVNGTATISVIPVPVASVVIAPDSVEREIAATAQFTAVARDSAGGTLAGRTITWMSLNTAIATVDANGLATAVGAGLTSIVATSEGRADTARISVTTPTGAGPLVLGPFDLLVTANQDNGQGVATDGVDALYLVQGRSGIGESASLYAIRVDSTGAILAGPTSLNSNGDPPAVAYGGGTYLAATWRSHDTNGIAIVAWLISVDGNTVSTPITVYGGAGAGELCGLAFANGRFGLTYRRAVGVNAAGGVLYRVYGKSVSPTGFLSDEVAISPSFATCGMAINGALASDGSVFLATWAVQDSATASAGESVQARTVETTGVLGTVHTVRVASVQGRLLSAAARATGGWVVGMAELVNVATSDFDSYVQPLAADGSPSGGVITIDNSSGIVIGTVSEWESGFVVLTIERPGAAATQVVRLRRFDTANAPTGSDLLVAGVDGASKLPIGVALAGQARLFIALEFTAAREVFLDFDESSNDARGVWVRP